MIICVKNVIIWKSIQLCWEQRRAVNDAGLVKVTVRKVPYAYACFLFSPYWVKILWNSDAF